MQQIDSATFRDALAALPAGITIVTTIGKNGAPMGATVSAFMSLSVDPPLVLLSLHKESRTAQAAIEAEAFAVHIVRAEHRDLAMLFASKAPDKFAGTPHRLNARGVPVLHGFDVSLECGLHAHYPGGDHLILVGLVEATQFHEPGVPAVWYDRAFYRLAHIAAGTE